MSHCLLSLPPKPAAPTFQIAASSKQTQLITGPSLAVGSPCFSRTAVNDFIEKLQAFRLRHMADDAERANLSSVLKQVQEYCLSLEEALKGSDDPDVLAAGVDDPE